MYDVYVGCFTIVITFQHKNKNNCRGASSVHRARPAKILNNTCGHNNITIIRTLYYKLGKRKKTKYARRMISLPLQQSPPYEIFANTLISKKFKKFLKISNFRFTTWRVKLKFI